MPSQPTPVWKDLAFLKRYQLAKTLLAFVFNLNKKTEHAFWKSVIERVRAKKLNPAEYLRLEEAMRRPEWQTDAIRLKNGQLPEPIEQLPKRLARDYLCRLQHLLAQHQQRELTHGESQYVWERTLTHLGWQIHRCIETMIAHCEKGVDWESKLDKLTKEQIELLTNPDPLFRDLKFLLFVSQAMKTFIRQTLGIKSDAQATTRERIRGARDRVALKSKQQNAPGTTHLSAEELREVLPWPDSFHQLLDQLRSEDRARSFVRTGRAMIHQHITALLKREVIRSSDTNPCELKMTIFEELVDLKAFQISKNGEDWHRELIAESATTWAIRVLSHLRKDVERAYSGHHGGVLRDPFRNLELVRRDDAPEVEEQPIAQEVPVLRDAIIQLPNLERAVLCWRLRIDSNTLEEQPMMPDEAIAHRLGIAVETIQDIYEAACERLRELLAP